VSTGPIIGYYVHHQGSGHAHRALAISSASSLPITGLSTAPRPPAWLGDWVSLPDDAGATDADNCSAYGRLHYVPEHHPGLRNRMAAISAWIAATRPAALVVDVSVEVALLARLHGVPVVTVAMPGERVDSAHRLGYDLSEAILAPWPRAAGALWQAAGADLDKTTFLGAVSRFTPVRLPGPPSNQVVVLNGTGGGGATPADVRAAAAATPEWEWVHLDRAHGSWVDDPWPLLCSAAVIVSHAGQNAIAEIAAARRPAIVIPQQRPFGEQAAMGRALAGLREVPALVRPGWPTPDRWPDLLSRASRLDGSGWAVWNDGRGAERAAAMLESLAEVPVATESL
jgi:hypothetical protein